MSQDLMFLDAIGEWTCGDAASSEQGFVEFLLPGQKPALRTNEMIAHKDAVSPLLGGPVSLVLKLQNANQGGDTLLLIFPKPMTRLELGIVSDHFHWDTRLTCKTEPGKDLRTLNVACRHSKRLSKLMFEKSRDQYHLKMMMFYPRAPTPN